MQNNKYGRAGQQTVVTTARTSSKNLLQQLPAGRRGAGVPGAGGDLH